MTFYKEKKRKLWVWIAIDRYTQKVLGFSVGSRGQKTFKALMKQISKYPVDYYGTDEWKIYKSLTQKKHLTGKKHTAQIESLNANFRHYLARFRRRTRCYSMCPVMVELSIFLLFFKDIISILF